MPIDATEAVSLISEATEFAAALVKALRKDPDGRVRIDKSERQELLKKLGSLTLHLTRDALD